jgi:hypothetical protein
MSSIKIQGNYVGDGVFTLSAPASNSNYTLTLPDATTTIAGTASAQTLTNKTFGSGLVMGATTLTSGGVVPAGGTSMVLATGLPSWVKSVSVVMIQLSTTGTSAINIQLGTGSTPTWVTTGYQSGSDNYSSVQTGSPGTLTVGLRIGRSIGAGSSTTAIYTLCRMGTTDKWVGQLNGILDTGTSVVFGGGYVTLASPLTAVRITTQGGTDTFDTGNAVVWYE